MMIPPFNTRTKTAGKVPRRRLAVTGMVFLITGAFGVAVACAQSVPSTNAPLRAAGSALEAAPPALPDSASMFFSLFRVMGALAIVLGVFFGGLWLFRNWQRVLARNGQSPKLNVIEVKSLGQRHALYVVGFEQQRMLIASSPTGLTLLTALPPEAKVQSPEAEVASQGAPDDFGPGTRDLGLPSPAPRFTDALCQALNRTP